MLKDVGVNFTDDFTATGIPGGRPLLVCFSHLRWDFVFQRPQHLMTRFAISHNVHVWEEPIFVPAPAAPRVEARTVAPNLTVATPQLIDGMPEEMVEAALCSLLDDYLGTDRPEVAWYYTPMMLPFSRHLEADCTVYDCMDELANFRFAAPRLLELEAELLDRADLVFTGGYSLYEAKRSRHSSVHPFPSSVDIAHFARARASQPANERPTFGFYGVIDERFDLDLLAAIADARPDWRFVMVGPVVKISPDELPKRENIAYPGPATYDQLPAVLSGWDVALMPFAINDATRFISPTKTPEYLAAGKPVVSTPIRDVIRHYGDLEGVRIASTCPAFVAAIDAAMKENPRERRARADRFLANMSWERTWDAMDALI